MICSFILRSAVSAIGVHSSIPHPSSPIPEEAKHEQEQVNEVEIELQCAHHGLAACGNPVLHRVVHFLDPLGIPGGHSSEDQYAGRGVTKSSAVLLRKMLTTIAINNPKTPTIKNDPKADRSRCVE